jgi:purine-binding chemotaxis protein CheW
MTQNLTFILGGHEVAIPLLQVRQIIKHVPPTFVPQLPAAIRGVINLRGALVPVVDLTARFGLPSQPVSHTTCIVVVDAPVVGMLGVIADEVKNVVEVEPSAILDTPDFGSAISAEDLVGVTEIDGRLVLILDTTRVFSPNELLAAARVPMPPAASAA